MKNRNLSLTPRKEETREKQEIIQVQEFTLNQIKVHFDNNMLTINNQFKIADELKENNDLNTCEYIWRSQIVFLESALDFYIHEISKYAMINMFSGKWEKSAKYDNYAIKMKYVEEHFKNPESKQWLLKCLNERFSKEVYLSEENMRDQLNIIGIGFESVMEKSFPKSNDPSIPTRDGKTIVKDLFDRRNQIAHQTDKRHSDAVQNEITKEYVKQCFDDIN